MSDIDMSKANDLSFLDIALQLSKLSTSSSQKTTQQLTLNVDDDYNYDDEEYQSNDKRREMSPKAVQISKTKEFISISKEKQQQQKILSTIIRVKKHKQEAQWWNDIHTNSVTIKSPSKSPKRLLKHRSMTTSKKNLTSGIDENSIDAQLKSNLAKFNDFMAEQLKNSTKLSWDRHKLQENWHLIHEEFKSSTYFKIARSKVYNEEKGIHQMFQFTYHAVYPSSIIAIICSSSINISYEDLVSIFNRFLFIGESEIMLGRKIAALQAIIDSKSQSHWKLVSSLQKRVDSDIASYERELIVLRQLEINHGNLISIKEFKDLIFSDEEVIDEYIPLSKPERMNIYTSHVDKIANMFEEWKQCLHQIQPSAGRMTIYRHKMLIDFISHLDQSMENFEEEYLLSVDDMIVRLLGLDCFPILYRNTYQNRKMKLKSQLDHIQTRAYQLVEDNVPKLRVEEILHLQKLRKSDSQSKTMNHPKYATTGFEYKFRLQINNILQKIVYNLILGKGFLGLVPLELAEVLQCYAITRIQAYFRGFSKRWRYQLANKKYYKRQLLLASSCFQLWHKNAEYSSILRFSCFRIIVAWRFHTRRIRLIRNRYRLMFWPFYVLKRQTNRSILLHEKIKFLISRVIPTYVELVIFRRWKGLSHSIKRIETKVHSFCLMNLQKKKLDALLWWLYWKRRIVRLRQAHLKASSSRYNVMQQSHKVNCFETIRLYSYYKRQLKDRTSRYAMTFRNLLFRLSTSETSAIIKSSTRPMKLSLTIPDSFELSQHEIEELQVNTSIEEKDAIESMKVESSRPPMKFITKSQKHQLQSFSSIQHVHSMFLKANSSNGLSTTIEDHDYENEIKRYRWVLLDDMKMQYDIESDDDTSIEDVEYQGVVSNAYNDELLDQLKSPFEIRFLKMRKTSYLEAFMPMFNGFHKLDLWLLFESSMRFHRFGRRCFYNLKSYAKIKRNARNSYEQVKHQMIKQHFIAWRGWVNDDPNFVKEINEEEVLDGTFSEADVIYNQLKKLRISKIHRRRQLFKQLRDQDDRDDRDDREEDGNEANQCNIISDANDKSSLVVETLPTIQPINESTSKNSKTKEKSKRKTKPLTSNSKNVEVVLKNPTSSPSSSSIEHLVVKPSTSTSIPRLLDWDREDRLKDIEVTRNALILSHQFVEKSILCVIDSNGNSESLTLREKERSSLLKNLLLEETIITNESIAKELEYSNKYSINAIRFLVETLAKVYDQVQVMLRKSILKKYYRLLRLPMYDRRCKSLFARKQLMSWLVICVKRKRLYAYTSNYHQKKKLWVTWNRWLKYIDHQTTIRSTKDEFMKSLNRRRDLYRLLSDELQQSSLLKMLLATYASKVDYFESSHREGLLVIEFINTIQLIISIRCQLFNYE